MSDRYFNDYPESYGTGILIDKDRLIDIRDERWGHPVLREAVLSWDQSALSGTAAMWNPALTIEQKIEIGNQAFAALADLVVGGDDNSTCDVTTYTVPGCPEEPETAAEVYVYRPKSLTKKKARCMFYCLGGALVVAEPAMAPLPELAERFNCSIVVVKFRTSLQAPYPAAINDLHAGYQWMVENAEALQINPNNVVLVGQSSGSQLALNMAFRLKRYGFKPKGVVAVVPQTGDTANDNVAIMSGNWDTIGQHDALSQWMGRNYAFKTVGPEALANSATVADCVGLPPIFIHTAELDPDRNANREFYGKLLEAGVYAEYHVWGGAHHASAQWSGVGLGGELNEYSERVKAVYDGNINDCFNYDLSRDWYWDEKAGK